MIGLEPPPVTFISLTQQDLLFPIPGLPKLTCLKHGPSCVPLQCIRLHLPLPRCVAVPPYNVRFLPLRVLHMLSKLLRLLPIPWTLVSVCLRPRRVTLTTLRSPRLLALCASFGSTPPRLKRTISSQPIERPKDIGPVIGALGKMRSYSPLASLQGLRHFALVDP